MRDFIERLLSVREGRERNYAHPWDNFARIAKFDEALAELPEGPEKVALHNIGQKMARLIHAILVLLDPDVTAEDIEGIRDGVTDGWLDIAGYAECGNNIMEQRIEEILDRLDPDEDSDDEPEPDPDWGQALISPMTLEPYTTYRDPATRHLRREMDGAVWCAGCRKWEPAEWYNLEPTINPDAQYAANVTGLDPQAEQKADQQDRLVKKILREAGADTRGTALNPSFNDSAAAARRPPSLGDLGGL